MLEWILALVPPAATLAAGIPIVRRGLRRWREAARILGFHYRPGIFAHHGVIASRNERWHLEASLKPGDGTKTRIVITALGEFPRDLSIHRRGLFVGTEEGTGDYYLDDRALVRGSTVSVLTTMTPLVRRRVGRLCADGRLTLEEGKLMLLHPRPKRAEDLVEWITEGIDLVDRMSGGVPDDERLLANLESESNPRVRHRLLLAILSVASEPIRSAAVRASTDDTNDQIRLVAVKALGAAGWEESVMLYRDLRVEEQHRAAALRHLARTFGKERTLSIVIDALDDPRPLVVATAVEGIGVWRHKDATPKLSAMARIAPPEVTEVIAGALGRIGGREAERALLRLLAAQDREVRRAAVDALGRAGTLHTIQILSQIREASLKRSVRDAIGAIQARCGHRNEGALSLDEALPSQGSISLPADAGALSVDDG